MDILSYLPQDHPWRGQIVHLSQVDSTNDYAKKLAEKGAPQGTVVVADCQTGGRGRRGRTFHSPEKMGVYLSVILRPKAKAEEIMHLTCAVAVAMVDAVYNASGIAPKIKWINDLLWGNRKLGGILTELSVKPNGDVDYAIVGIGINCLQREFPEEIRDMATSLTLAADREIAPARLAGEMILALCSMADTLLSEKESVMGRYEQNCVTLGKEIKIIQGEKIRYGTALKLDWDGALLVRLEDGREETVQSGEVSVRGLYGYL